MARLTSGRRLAIAVGVGAPSPSHVPTDRTTDARCSTNARPPSSGPSWRSTSRPPSRWGRRTSCRSPGGAGVVGHGAQRHGHARAGGLPPPAPHQRRPGPHREGLPLLRRQPRAARPASRPPRRRAGALLLRRRPTASSSRCCRTPAACSATSPATPAVVVGPAADRGHRPVGAARRPRAHDRAAGRRCCRTARSRSTPSSSPTTVGEERARRRPPPTSPPTSSGAARRRARRRSRAPATPPPTRVVAQAAARCARERRRRARPRLRRRHRRSGRGLRRDRDGARGARRSSSSSSSWSRCCATSSTGACRWPSAPRPAWQPLAECSLVVAPYEVEGEPAGTIGVLGPDPHELPAGAGGGRRRQPAALGSA